MKYIVYNPITGRISKVCTVSNMRAALLQAGPGEEVIEGHANDAKQKIVDGQVVDKTQAELAADNPLPPVVPESDREVGIKKRDWDSMLHRLELLETGRRVEP